MNKIILSLALLLSIQAVGARTIDTTPYALSTVTPFGQPIMATFGQTISMKGEDGILNSFSFYLSPLDENIKAYVYEWDGLKATGSAVYESSVINIGNNFTGFKEVTFNPNVFLDGMLRYVLFLSTSGLHDSTANTNTWQLSVGGYDDGYFVYTDSGNDFSKITSTDWSHRGSFATGVLAFKAEISAVPEPEPLTLSIAGLVLLGMKLRHRKQ